MYFPWSLESLESPSECGVSHIVIFLTWLLESPSECEIAHMVPRARTLVPISESETKLTYQAPGFSQRRRCVIARGRLRGRPARPRPPRAPPRASESPLRGPPGPRRQGGLGGAVCGAPRAVCGAPRGVCGHGRAPAGAGAFGSAFEVRQDVRQVCGVVAAELFEEVDFDVHRGLPFSLSPCRTSILSTATPPCQAPRLCPSPHFRAPYATVTHLVATFANVAVGYTYAAVTYCWVTYSPVTFASVIYHGVTYTCVAVTYGYVGKSRH